MKRLGLSVVLIGCLVMSSAGCATTGGGGLGQDIQTAEEYAAGASTAIDAMTILEKGYFAVSPNLAIQTKVELIIAQAKAALSVLQTALAGASDINSKDVTDAFTAFEQTYNQLIAFLNTLNLNVKPSGTANKVGVSPGGLIVPAARTFAPKGLALPPPKA